MLWLLLLGLCGLAAIMRGQFCRSAKIMWRKLPHPDMTFDLIEEYVSFARFGKLRLPDDVSLQIHQLDPLEEGAFLCRLSYHQGNTEEEIAKTGFMEIVLFNRCKPTEVKMIIFDHMPHAKFLSAGMKAAEQLGEGDDLEYVYQYSLETGDCLIPYFVHILGHASHWSADGREVQRYPLADDWQILQPTGKKA